MERLLIFYFILLNMSIRKLMHVSISLPVMRLSIMRKAGRLRRYESGISYGFSSKAEKPIKDLYF
jgi:hypothetical protein